MKTYYNEVVEAILQGAVKATKYVAPNSIVRAVRKTYKVNNRRPDNRHNVEIHLTIGKPNYQEREFIKDCKKAGEPFPVKRIQLKVYNPKTKHIEKENLQPRKASK